MTILEVFQKVCYSYINLTLTLRIKETKRIIFIVSIRFETPSVVSKRAVSHKCMNNIHKVIFSKALQQLVVVSELAKSAGKAKAISADSLDIVSVLQNFSEKRPLVDGSPSTSGYFLANVYILILVF